MSVEEAPRVRRHVNYREEVTVEPGGAWNETRICINMVEVPPIRAVSPRPPGSLTRGEYARIKKEVQDVIAKAEAEGRDVPSYADVLRSKLPFNHPSRLDPNGPLLICIA